MEYSSEVIKQIITEKADIKVSDEAAEELGEMLELFAGYVTEEAVGRANEEGRKVINKEDIEKALE